MSILKRTYTDEEGREYHTLEFVFKKERDRAERVVGAWDDRIKLLFNIGHDLVENGKKVCEWDDMDDIAEGRVRIHVGLELISWGELLLFKAKDRPMDKQLEKIDDLVEKVKESLGGDEEFQKALTEMRQIQKEESA
jgi:hypothetical protein